MTIFALSTSIVFGQDKNKEVVQRWDAGLSGGIIMYGDVAGFQGMIETRAYILDTAFDLNVFVGAGGLFDHAISSQHDMTDIYGYALGGADWSFFKKEAPLSLRAQLSLGGGNISDRNSDGTERGSPGFLLVPAIGAEYGFQKLHVNLMVGYKLMAANDLTLTGATICLGASYSIFDRNGK